MKISKVYEVWVGGDMIDDQLTLEEALTIARQEFTEQRAEHPNDPADVVIDEHSYIEIENIEELDLVDNDPQW